MCGAVKFRADVPEVFSTCFCKMCQRWASGVFMGAHSKGFEVTEGADHLTVFKSSDWAERGFCGRCGSNLFYRMRDSGGHSIAIGTLDDTSGLKNNIRYFSDKRPEGIEMPAGAAKEMTEAECMAAFGGGDD